MANYIKINELNESVEKVLGKGKYKITLIMTAKEDLIDFDKPKETEFYATTDFVDDVLVSVRIIVNNNFNNITKAFASISGAKLEGFKEEAKNSLEVSGSASFEKGRKFPVFGKKFIRFNILIPLNKGQVIINRKLSVSLDLNVEKAK